jgi:hypothetical protein
MARNNRCPNCHRSRGSMTHKTKCLGKGRGDERAKARSSRAARKAGLVRASSISWLAGGATPTTPSGGDVVIMASESFYSDRAANAEAVPA